MENSGNRKLEALIIDDDIDFFYLLTQVLREKNIYTSQVKNLFEAQRLLRVKVPDFIFIDNRLPDGKGIDFIGSIRITCPEAKIIAFSGDDSPLIRKRALLEGAIDFLSKPATIQRINSVIDRLMAKELSE